MMVVLNQARVRSYMHYSRLDRMFPLMDRNPFLISLSISSSPGWFCFSLAVVVLTRAQVPPGFELIETEIRNGLRSSNAIFYRILRSAYENVLGLDSELPL